MTVRTPCVEWEQSTKNTKTKEGHREENTLHPHWDIMKLSNLEQIHCMSATTEVDTKNTNKQECGTSHQHQGKFHRCILLRTTTPNTNKKVHWDKCYLIEQKHGEEILRDEKSENTC